MLLSRAFKAAEYWASRWSKACSNCFFSVLLDCRFASTALPAAMPTWAPVATTVVATKAVGVAIAAPALLAQMASLVPRLQIAPSIFNSPEQCLRRPTTGDTRAAFEPLHRASRSVSGGPSVVTRTR